MAPANDFITRSVSKSDVNWIFFDKLDIILDNVEDYKKLEFDAVARSPGGKRY